MDVVLSDGERDEAVNAEGDARRAPDERKEPKELVVHRIVALSEKPALLLRREKAPPLLLAVAKLGKAVRELHAVNVELPPFGYVAAKKRKRRGLLWIDGTPWRRAGQFH